MHIREGVMKEMVTDLTMDMDGYLEISNIKVHKNMKREFFAAGYKELIAQECKCGNEFVNYLIKPQKCDDKYCILRVYFQSENIYGVEIFFNDKCQFLEWSDCNKKHVMQQKKFNDKILAEKLGKPPYKYNWGTISSVCDLKGGAGYISIRYD